MPIFVHNDKKSTATALTAYQFYIKNVVDPIKNYLTNHRHGWFQWMAAIGDDVAKEMMPAVKEFDFLFNDYAVPIKEFLEGEFGKFATAALNSVLTNLEKNGNVTPEQASTVGGQALADAFGFGIASFATTAIFELLLPEKLNTLNGVGPILSTLAGFAEVTANVIGPALSAGVGLPSRYAANTKFRALLPGLAQAVGWFAQGLIDAPTRDKLIGYAGLAPAYADAEQAAAYRGYSPRQLLRIIESGLITQDEINDELTFARMRPASQARLLKAAPYLATATYRSQLHAALGAEYIAGLLTDQQLTQAIDAAENNTNRDNLILQRLAAERNLAEVKEFEQAYATSYLAGTMDLQTYQSILEGIIPDQARRDAIVAVSQAKRGAAVQRKADAQAAALERQTENAARAAALQMFRDGTYDAAALGSALLATGLAPEQIPSWVSRAQAQQAGAARYLYGKLLAPPDYKVLSDRVNAIAEQLKKGLITLANARAQLNDLDLDPHELAALLAKWAAMIGATTTHGILLDAVTGEAPPVAPPAPAPPTDSNGGSTPPASSP